MLPCHMVNRDNKQWVVVACKVDSTNVLAKNPHEEALQVQLAFDGEALRWDSPTIYQ